MTLAASAEVTGVARGDAIPQPLSQRVLARLPAPRALSIAVWASIPWLNAGLNLLLGSDRTSPVWEQGRLLVLLNYAAISLAVGVSLWGTDRIARRVHGVEDATSRILEGKETPRFRGMESTLGPTLASAAAALLFGTTTLARDGLAPGIVRGVTWFVIGIAIFSFLWTYASLLLGLDRLGRERLVLDRVVVDPSLGLQPLGSVAASGLWMLLVWLVPVLLTGLPDVVGAVSGMAVLTAVLATFFLSVLRLHRQMVEVKARELSLARDLYAQAYLPVYEQPTLDTLERQRGILGAADALEKRANSIHEWPFAERTPTLVITVATSVVAMTIGRLILDPFGL